MIVMQDWQDISLRTLGYFLRVYETRNFSTAARLEDVSVPVISRAVNRLENCLNQQLFYRNTRAITPTETGRLFAEYAYRITAQFQTAEQALTALNQAPAGLIRINAPVVFGQKHIAPHLAGLLQRYPQLRVELNQTDDYTDPHKQTTDLIFRIGNPADSGLKIRQFARQRDFLAAAPAYLAAQGTPQTPDELPAHQCLLYNGAKGPDRWYYKTARQPQWQTANAQAVLTSNNVETLVTAALNGAGLVVFPDWLIGEHINRGELVPVLADYGITTNTEPQFISVTYPNTRHHSLNVRAVIDYFVDAFGEPPYWQV